MFIFIMLFWFLVPMLSSGDVETQNILKFLKFGEVVKICQNVLKSTL